MGTFASIVRECFDEIAASYGMRCAEEHEFHVRYENDQVTFGLAWDRRRSYELGLAISLTSRRNDLSTFELPDILRLEGAEAAANEIEVLRIEPWQDVREPVSRLAKLTRAYAHRFLAGDPEGYVRIAEFMRRRVSEYGAPLAGRNRRIAEESEKR